MQDIGRASISSEGSRIGSVHMAARIDTTQVEKAGPASPWISATDQCKSKSVRFECDFDSSSSIGSSENCCQTLGKSESPGNQSISKPFPYPTPLKLSDEMQTPGTVFPASMDLPNGKTRIRSQYVYPVLNPVESASQWKALKEDDSSSHKLSGELRVSVGKPEFASPKSKEGVKETASGEEFKVEASLSSWLKPQPSNQGDFSSRSRARKSPVDRPIIGMVAAHWNEEEPTRISPKWWDGNGIPNSTNKYKEVCHATEFSLFFFGFSS